MMMVGFNKDNQHTQPFQPLIQQQCKHPNKVVPQNSKGFLKGNQTSLASFLGKQKLDVNCWTFGRNHLKEDYL
jgi:hypothetical protein